MKNKKNIYLWIVSSFICTFGDVFTTTAIPLLTYKITNSAKFAVLVFLLDVLPEVILSTIIGKYIDKHSKKKIIIISCIFSFSLLVLLPILNNQWIYLFGNSILSISNLFYSFAARTTLPQLVEDDIDFSRVNSLITLALKIARVLGTTLAALLILRLNSVILLFVDALTFLITAIIVFVIKFNQTISNDEKEDTNAKIIDLISFIINEKKFLICTVLYSLIFIIETAIGSQSIVYIEKDLGLSDFYYGLFQDLQLIGVLIGQAIFSKIIIANKEHRIVRTGILITASSLLLMCITKCIYFSLLIGFAHPFVETSWYSYFYRNINNKNLGKTLSICTVFFDLIELLSLGCIYLLNDIITTTSIYVLFGFLTLFILSMCYIYSKTHQNY